MVKNRYPLPLISRLRDQLSGVRYFTRLDLLTAYAHIRIKEGDEWKTAFRTPYGHYEYLVMPFGLTNVLATFQAAIDYVIRHCLDRFAVCYLDDILIYSKILEEHKTHVRQVLCQGPDGAPKGGNAEVKGYSNARAAYAQGTRYS